MKPTWWFFNWWRVPRVYVTGVCGGVLAGKCGFSFHKNGRPRQRSVHVARLFFHAANGLVKAADVVRTPSVEDILDGPRTHEDRKRRIRTATLDLLPYLLPHKKRAILQDGFFAWNP